MDTANHSPKLPVADRDRFLAAMQGSKGADGDVVGTPPRPGSV